MAVTVGIPDPGPVFVTVVVGRGVGGHMGHALLCMRVVHLMVGAFHSGWHGFAFLF